MCPRHIPHTYLTHRRGVGWTGLPRTVHGHGLSMAGKRAERARSERSEPGHKVPFTIQVYHADTIQAYHANTTQVYHTNTIQAHRLARPGPAQKGHRLLYKKGHRLLYKLTTPTLYKLTTPILYKLTAPMTKQAHHTNILSVPHAF